GRLHPACRSDLPMIAMPSQFRCLAVFLGATSASWGFEGPAVQELKVGNTFVRVAPAVGCNVFSLNMDGVEFLQGPTDVKALPSSKPVGDLSAFLFGASIMYPSPNRVRDAKFAFEGRSYSFKANAGSNFMHGLVHSVPWEFLGRTDKPG